jgi:hypothetical protein
MSSAKGVSDGDYVEQPGVVTELRRTLKSCERHPKKMGSDRLDDRDNRCPNFTESGPHDESRIVETYATC